MDNAKKVLRSFSVTLDTNLHGRRYKERLEKAIDGLPVYLAHISVTARELEPTDYSPRGTRILEIGVWGESRWDEGVYGDSSDGTLFETLLTIMSSNSFPKIGKREQLSKGNTSHLRDAMIFLAHMRARRDIFLTNEKKAFIGPKGSKRETLERLSNTKIMNLDEFYDFCDQLRKEAVDE